RAAIGSTLRDRATDSNGPMKNDPSPGAVLGLNMTAALTMPGAISLSSSSHFPVRDGSKLVKPVALLPGRAMLATKPLPKGSDTPTNTIGMLRVSRRRAKVAGGGLGARETGRRRDTPFSKNRAAPGPPGGKRKDILAPPPSFPPPRAHSFPPVVPAPLGTGGGGGVCLRVVPAVENEHSAPTHWGRLLRGGRERPRRRSPAEQRDELAPPHSITSSASASSGGGTVRPSIRAVLRLIASSYFTGACTGRSAGFSPLRMRSTYSVARRTGSSVSGP